MYADERVLADLRATANAPLCLACSSVMLGTGIVGGTLMANRADVVATSRMRPFVS